MDWGKKPVYKKFFFLSCSTPRKLFFEASLTRYKKYILPNKIISVFNITFKIFNKK